VAAAYSVRPTPDARVSAPLTWAEIGECDPRDFTLKTMPPRCAQVGDRHADIDRQPCSLAALLDLSARQEREGQGDAPWPPHFRKQPGEPSRVQPSRRRQPAERPQPADHSQPADHTQPQRSGRRVSKMPLIEIGRAQRKEDALAGLERWKAKHADAARHLTASDVLVDAMRGRFHTWTRIRINLQHVPPALRPPQDALDPDEV
jgi:hypothetical protein